MADAKVSALASISTVGATDLLYIVDDTGASFLSRKVTVADFNGALTHNDLSGLTAGDPHTQYPYMSGRAGGQTIVGGTALNDNLRLDATSAGVTGDGRILLGDAFAIAIANGVDEGHRLYTGNNTTPGNSELAAIGTDDLKTYGLIRVQERPDEFTNTTGGYMFGTGETFVRNNILLGGVDSVDCYMLFRNTAPSHKFAFTDHVYLYCLDEAADDARLYVKSEVGTVVKIGGGNVSTDTFTSVITTGTAPLTVASTTRVDNLNSTMTDGSDLEELLRGDLRGLYMTNAADADHDITVSQGICWSDTSSTGNRGRMRRTSSITKRIDALWSEGNNQGGRLSGSLTSSTMYHVFLIGKDPEVAGSEITDVIFSTSLTPTLPGTYHLYRLLGHVVTDASANIRPINHSATVLAQTTPILIIDTTTLGTSRTNFSWIDLPDASEHRLMLARVYIEHATQDARVIFTTDDEPDTAPSTTGGQLASVSTIAGKGMFHTIVLRTGGDNVYARSSHTNTILRVSRLADINHNSNRFTWAP